MKTARVATRSGKRFAVVGLWLQLGPVLGLLGTVIGMLQGFKALSAVGGVTSPDDLANGVGLALWTTAFGLLIGLVGVVCILVALFYFRFRASWFFWWLTAISIWQLIIWPIGTLIGIAMLIFLVLNRSEFLGDTTVETVSK